MLSQSFTGKLELFWSGCLFENDLSCWHGVLPAPPQRCCEVVTYCLNHKQLQRHTALASVNQNQFVFSVLMRGKRKG